jgi:outer membrane protein OmpA-like peptidoglycan-associated protein
MFQRHNGEIDSGVDYSSHWIPYSDLMAGLLGVFALTLVVAIAGFGAPLQEVEESLEARKAVAEKLREEFEGDTRVTISESGAVSLQGEVLFESNRDTLSAKGMQVLTNVVPRYLGVVQANEDVRENLHRVRVEGHADREPPRGMERGSDEAYLYNMKLSQRRATSVVSFLLESDSLKTFRSFMKDMFVASGRSSADPIRDEQTQKIDDDASRRIQLDLVLKDEALVDSLLGILGKLNLSSGGDQ